MVADARNHLPGISAVARPEERCWLHATQEVLLVIPRFERPNVGQRAPVILREGGSRLRLLELLAQIGRTQDLHAEEGITARGVEARRSARVDQSGVHGHAWSDRPIQREAAAGLRRLGDEQALFGTNGENDSFWHVETPEWTGRIVVTHATSVGKDPGRFSDNQPPETAGRMKISSPGTSAVSSPSRSRMWSLFTNKFTCRLTAPVSSQMPRYNEGCRRSSSSSTARTLAAESMSSDVAVAVGAQLTRNVDRDVLRSCHRKPNE